MQVIKQSSLWPFYFTCRKCKSQLAAEKEDVTKGYITCWCEPTETWYFVQCPECDTKTRVPSELLTKAVVKSAAAKIGE